MLKKAAKLGLIEEPLAWNQCRKLRNYTSHNYNEDAANESYKIAKLFLPLVKNLLLNLEKINQNDE